MNKKQQILDLDIFFFFLSTFGNIISLFLVINNKRITNNKTGISKEETNNIEKLLHILFLITSSYFLIIATNKLNKIKKHGEKENIKRQELQALASFFFFLSALIKVLNDDHNFFTTL